MACNEKYLKTLSVTWDNGDILILVSYTTKAAYILSMVGVSENQTPIPCRLQHHLLAFGVHLYSSSQPLSRSRPGSRPRDHGKHFARPEDQGITEGDTLSQSH